MSYASTMSIGVARREAHELGRGASADHVPVEPAPDPDDPLRRAASRSMSTRWHRGSGNGATAPGSKPVARATSSARRDAGRRRPPRAATFSGSARRSPGTSASTGRPSQSKTSDLTICRGRSRSRGGSGRRRRAGGELLEPRLGAARRGANAATRSTAPATSVAVARGSGRAMMKRASSKPAGADALDELGRRPGCRSRAPSAPCRPGSSARRPCSRC